MKKKILIASIILAAHAIYCQEVIPAASGVATGTGTISYSVGQLVYSINAGSNGTKQTVFILEVKTIHYREQEPFL